MLAGRPLDKPDPATDGRAPPAGTAPARPAELEDWLNRNLYHPLSIRLARGLERTFVTPNMVSGAGGVTVAAAGLVYVLFDSIAGAVCGLALHMAWHVLDGADGDLARLTGRASRYGETVDGLSDYAGHFVLYLLLASVLGAQIGPVGWVLMIVTGLVRIPQTVFYETQRRQYQWWVYGKEWVRISATTRDADSGIVGAILRFYLWLSSLLEADGGRLDTALEEADDAQRAQLRSVITARFPAVLWPLSLLSSNYRTIGIGLAMILGSPIYYVFFELIGLTVLMLVLMGRAKRTIAEVRDQAESNAR